MADEAKLVLKAEAIEKMEPFRFQHPLNANSEVLMRPISSVVGLERVGVTLTRVPAGRESFVYHSHRHEEEWIYVLSGRGIAEVGDQEIEVSGGDFMGFPTPSVGHNLRNPYDEDLVYLMGGERRQCEVAIFPRHNKRLIRDGDSSHIVDDSALEVLDPGSGE